MTPDDPRHGTNACYHRGCRCPDCKAAARAYESHRRRMLAYGRWEPLVDARRAREHCRALLAAGMGPVTIAKVSGVPHGAVSKLLYGDSSRKMAPSRHIRKDTETKLLRVEATLDNLAGATQVDATGTRRRIEALACIGWSISAQAKMLGRKPTNFIRTRTKTTVHASTARAVRDLYDRLSMMPAVGHGPARARLHAQRHGWIPPLGWDEGEIDDPDARPHVRGCAPKERAGSASLRTLMVEGRTRANDYDPLARIPNMERG